MKIIKVGGSGTEQGMSQRQRTDFIMWVSTNVFDEFHHGDCIGADEEMQDIVKMLFPGTKIVIHPPDKDRRRAFSHVRPNDELLSPRPYLTRNADIAVAVDVLVAAPLGIEIRRSGTWATVRYARKAGKRVEILYR